jgi:hypothetical protein
MDLNRIYNKNKNVFFIYNKNKNVRFSKKNSSCLAGSLLLLRLLFRGRGDRDVPLRTKPPGIDCQFMDLVLHDALGGAQDGRGPGLVSPRILQGINNQRPLLGLDYHIQLA